MRIGQVGEDAGEPQRRHVRGIGSDRRALVGRRLHAAEPEVVHEVAVHDPRVRQLPVRRVLLKRRVAEVADAARRDVVERRFREASEHGPVATEIVIYADGVLVLILRQRANQLIVALCGT